jgi:hypothetical protein
MAASGWSPASHPLATSGARRSGRSSIRIICLRQRLQRQVAARQIGQS